MRHFLVFFRQTVDVIKSNLIQAKLRPAESLSESNLKSTRISVKAPILAFPLSSATLGKLLTHMCLCH